MPQTLGGEVVRAAHVVDEVHELNQNDWSHTGWLVSLC
jgi:hypothetical protein